MIRLGLTQRVHAVEGRDERRDCLDQAWSSLLLANGFLPLPLPNAPDRVGELVAGLEIDGVILTGGNDVAGLPGARNTAPERDRFEGRLIELCAERSIPVFGVCRGLQVLVLHWGGEVVPLAGHVAAPHPVSVQGAPDVPVAGRSVVNSFHTFGVRPEGLGAEMVGLAFAPDGSVEAASHRTLPQWGVMWHPEREPRDPADVELLEALFRRSRS